MKKIFNILFVFAVIVIIMTVGCVDKKTSDISSNKTSNGSLNNISEMILPSGNITEKEKVIMPAKTATPKRIFAKNKTNIVSVKVYDFAKIEYPEVIICLQSANKSWGNFSLGNVNDNANDGGDHIFQPSSSLAIKFEDNEHIFYLEDIGITLPYNDAVIIKVQKDCSKEVIGSVQ